jgi:cytochrome c-type biogenesis protein CcmH
MKRKYFLATAFFSLVLLLTWVQQTSAEQRSKSGGDTLRTVSFQEVNKIAHQLIAPCCWSEPADVHQSPAAEEVRAQIRAALQQGYTEQQILDSFVAAYGERILAKPTAKGFNLLVWILPAVAIVSGGFVAWRYLRHSTRTEMVAKPPQPASMDDPYARRLERELEEFDN